MSTIDVHTRPGASNWRRRALDAAVVALVFAFVPALVAARFGLELDPNPGWIAVLVLAAREGSVGLLSGLLVAAVAITLATTTAGAHVAAMWSRLDSAANLSAFGACLVVSWVGAWHLRGQADLRERQRALARRAAEAEATIESLRGVITKLRSRADRTLTSLSFLRDVATRLESRDPVAAAEGAADLALARSGACAVEVRVGASGFQRLLAIRDARGPRALTPLSLRDADLCVPMRNGADAVGVIALWGVPRHALDDATSRDLAAIAAWCVPAVAIEVWRPEESTGFARRLP
jgi:uncharacterized coiled-coil protein SlyX